MEQRQISLKDLQCNCGKEHYNGLDICLDCYKKLFEEIQDTVNEENNEDIILESETAEVKEVSPTVYDNSIQLKTGHMHFPKPYKVDASKIETLEDVVLLLSMLDIHIYDNHKKFDDVKHLLSRAY